MPILKSLAATGATELLAATSNRVLEIADLQTTKRRRSRSVLAKRLFFVSAAITVFISVLIIWTLAREAWAFISEVAFSQLSTIGWFPRRGLFDLSTLLLNSLQISAIAMLVAVPAGLGAAIYLSEYAHQKVRRVLKPTLEMLASVPSVVLGLFAISFITPHLLTPLIPEINFFNKLASGLAVGLLVIPLIASISEDALRAVPLALREASSGLGARKVTTSIRVVLPAAISGLVAAVIVGFSRAIGETMVVTIASGGGDTSLFNANPLAPGGTITSAMASLGLGTDQVAGNNLAFQSLFFLGAMLFAITLVLNMIGNLVVNRLRERY